MPIIYGAGMLLGEHSWIVTIAWVAVFFGVITWHMLARCPRCHKYFNWSSRRSHHFAEECTHCGLDLDGAP